MVVHCGGWDRVALRRRGVGTESDLSDLHDRTSLVCSPESQDPFEILSRSLDNAYSRILVINPAHGHFVDLQSIARRQGKQLCIEEPAVVFNPWYEVLRNSCADGLESALGIPDAIVEPGTSNDVVRTRDHLTLEASGDLSTAEQPRSDRDITAVLQDGVNEWCQRFEACGQIDIHVRNDVGFAGQPRPLERSASTSSSSRRTETRGFASAIEWASAKVPSLLPLSTTVIVSRRRIAPSDTRRACGDSPGWPSPPLRTGMVMSTVGSPISRLLLRC